MRVLLTGASGFIGSRVAKKLLQGGHAVAALARPETRLSRLPDLSGQLHIIAEDPSAPTAAGQIAAWRPETCIHLGWYAEPGKYLDSTVNLACLAASLRLIDTLIECGCRHFVGAGTCAEYAESPKPFVETDPTAPQTLYAASKLSLSLVGQQLAGMGKIGFSWGRIFYLYGPGEDERRVMPALARALLRGDEFAATKGEQFRDYLHVDDVAEAFVAMALSGASGVYNIASGNPIRMRDLMTLAGSILGKEHLIRFGAVPYRQWEPPHIAGDNSRLRKLGWKASFGLEEGMASAISYWRSKQPQDRH